jgi:DNA-binding Lrp family transcriptional regulator
LKDVELRLISELVKNSRRSDRELARTLGVSQPTVSRTRMRLEKQGLIEYSAFPNLPKLGFELISVTLAKRDYQKQPEINLQKAKDFVKRHTNIIFTASGIGIDNDRILISIHRDYSDYAKFMQEMKTEWAGWANLNSFLISLSSDIVQPLSLKRFAEDLKREGQK